MSEEAEGAYREDVLRSEHAHDVVRRVAKGLEDELSEALIRAKSPRTADRVVCSNDKLASGLSRGRA